ncbi:MAG: DUF1579 domain-containing protein [Gemmatimonadetes bacterium]|nr:DUF1579 domain-containing protein [Gemmatimonadota bacterium]
MIKRKELIVSLALTLGAIPATLSAQGPPDPVALTSAQKEAMEALSFMDGEWRGTAWTLLPTGEKHELVQTERIGSFLGGAVKVIEGRGYEADGTVSFNAMAVISYDPGTEAFNLRSYAQGQVGDFEFTPTEDGYEWTIPAGPMTIRYKAVITDGTFSEVGDRIVPGQDPIRFFEMKLQRLGDTDWPAAGAVVMR